MMPALRCSFLTTWAMRSGVRSTQSLAATMPERDGGGVPPVGWIGGHA